MIHSAPNRSLNGLAAVWENVPECTKGTWAQCRIELSVSAAKGITSFGVLKDVYVCR